ncbi:Sapep family Mn(2+)-dependent dipeptidase [Fusibacter tunisiensis]|uniref:Dipeptidase n=1 Tax=Fusibacter tunisiensis TaxID=1008308 RepID=A0ABS2MM83_9FIRM|nr:Sapep family Mn(2+)-dependent dipeptidase [Fusibacter tunisiensis]MBM7560518.1 putative dipeptidase [Fusibacter tunisiensis]
MKTRNYIEDNVDQMTKDLIDFIGIPSVIDEMDSNKPFGEAIDRALKWVLNQFEAIGFKTYYDPEGYYGYADYGEGREMLGILTHVDVVPGGIESHWTYGPFKGTLAGGRLYGRGVLDDKGPIVSVLYAMKALIAMEVPFNKRLRIIIGTDEENQWRGIYRYLKREEKPDFGFTPDASFPVQFAEKGLLQVRLKSTSKTDVRIKGGYAMNSIPESCVYHGNHIYKLEKQLKKMGFDHEIEGEELYVIGKSAHSSKPQMGVNAVMRMAMAAYDIGIESPILSFLYDKIGFTFHGETMFGKCVDAYSGDLTVSVNQLDMGAHGGVIGLDIRIPVTIDKKFIAEGIKRTAQKYGLVYDELDFLPPVFLPDTHPMIQTLRAVYEEETNLDGTPISSGGATYARALDNTVAFGPLFPGMPKLVHQADEYMDVKAFVKCTQIYAKAIERLVL